MFYGISLISQVFCRFIDFFFYILFELQKAEEVKCPVLLIFGEKDPDFSNPLEEAHEVSKSLSSTRTKYEIISGVGHYPHVEEPGLVLQMITDFLRDI